MIKQQRKSGTGINAIESQTDKTVKASVNHIIKREKKSEILSNRGKRMDSETGCT